MRAALFHRLSHAAAKSLLFLAVDSLMQSGEAPDALRGSGYRRPLAGIAFTLGALSLVGIPFLGGFIAKFQYAEAAFSAGGWRLWAVLAALTLSTALNAVYLIGAVIRIYRKPAPETAVPGQGACHGLALASLSLLNVLLGCCAVPLLRLIDAGLRLMG